LFVIIGNERIERIASAALVGSARLDEERLVGRPDGAGDEARPVRVAAGEVVGRTSG
jgi:hypothetical protein